VPVPLERNGVPRVVITGMGVVTVIGDSVDAFRDSLVAGRSGITRWRRAMDPRCYSQVGGDLAGFDINAHLETVGRAYPHDVCKRLRSLTRTTPLPGRVVAAAALQAYLESGVGDAAPPERVAHVLAGHNVNAAYIVENTMTFHDEPDYIEPLFGLHVLDTDVLSMTSELLTIRGPAFTVGGACASGNLAVLAGLDLLRARRADAVLVTGSPIEIEAVFLHSWALMDALSFKSFNDAPERASRPFDRRREGFVPSEGAGAIVLERLDAAQARGATIHAEVRGASSVSDACRLTRPDEDGQARAMMLALDDAGMTANEIDYINAHATSTPLGDAVEAAAIQAVFGTRARSIPISATKSMIGHCLSAAGVVELIATVLQMRGGFVHPTINQDEPDPAFDLDFVPDQAREARITTAMSNSFGFGGLNSSIVVGSAG
jgi:3-oxoacyl-(acyl-carrier-protein) synthase